MICKCDICKKKDSCEYNKANMWTEGWIKDCNNYEGPCICTVQDEVYIMGGVTLEVNKKRLSHSGTFVPYETSLPISYCPICGRKL